MEADDGADYPDSFVSAPHAEQAVSCGDHLLRQLLKCQRLYSELGANS